jgi:hypothetical protein
MLLLLRIVSVNMLLLYLVPLHLPLLPSAVFCRV